MKKNLSMFLLILLSLTACVSPYYLGFSKEEWESMDDNKRAELIHNYHQLHSAKKMLQDEKEVIDNKAPIQVLIANGTVMMPPFTTDYPYQPVSFSIPQGSCRQVLLEQIGGRHKVEMEVCFKKGILLLDPSRYDMTKMESSARLYHSSLWQHGFNYTHVNTTGYVRLKDATIRIHD